MFTFSVRERRAIAGVFLLGAIVGGGLGWVLADPSAAPLRGPLLGALAGLLCPAFVIVVRKVIWNSPLVRLPVAAFTAINLALNGLAVLAALLLARLIGSLPFDQPPPGFGMQQFAIASAVTLMFTAWFIVDRALGPGVLVGLFTGRFLQPRSERLVFLFADLAESSALAIQLGDQRFHALLSSLFAEIGRPIDRYGGSVHRYLGDEMIVTWSIEAGTRSATCVRCATAILDAIEGARGRMLAGFGVSPRLRIALHSGDVVAGELAGPRAEIVYSGDTVNTVARIAKLASRSDSSLLISEELLGQMQLPSGLDVHPLEAVQFKGRTELTMTYAIERSATGATS